jgi:uncharacterized protein YutE (UPF0331/DUF86 family)
LRDLAVDNLDVVVINFSLQPKLQNPNKATRRLDQLLQDIRGKSDRKGDEMRPSMLKRLERFNKGIEILNEIKQYTKEEFCSDIKLLSIAERNLQVCIDFLIDLSTHILSKIDAEIPETYKEIVEKIHTTGAIDKSLKQKLTDLIGLRNIHVRRHKKQK